MASTKPDTVVVACPGCGARFDISLSMVGRRARCAACETPFVVLAPASDQNSVEPATKSAEADAALPEYVGFECRVCNSRLYGRLEQVGKKIKCDDCGALTVVPPPPKPKPKNMPAALEGEQYKLWDLEDQPLPSQLVAAQPKYIAVKCSKCDTMMYATTKEVGQQIACPDCGKKHIVPPPPKQVVKPSVLAPDSLTPALDPAAHPGERPLILPPSAKMMHEERAEEEYARALEKSKRTGKPMEIDRRGRPVLPRYPLLTGVFPFLISGGVPVAWLAMSAGYFCALWVLLTGIEMSNAGASALTGMPIFTCACALLMICSAGTYSVLLQIVMDSSEGCREIQHWPSFTDWLGSLLYLGVAGPLSALPGWAIAQIPDVAANAHVAASMIGASTLIFFPIIMLSQLDINSPAGVLSGRILTSLARCPFSWGLFYLENAAIAAICGAATYFVAQNNPSAILWLMPLYSAALILFGRLLGRLAWRLAEAMGIESE